MTIGKQAQFNGASSLRKDGPTPLYYQLMEQLRQEIESGNWQSDQQIPSEADLCGFFGVSRAVVRQALHELEHEGLLIRRQGRGTYVTPPRMAYHLAQGILGFYEDMAARGTPPVSKVLKQAVEPASRTVAEYLELAPGDNVLVIERLRYVSDEPILIVTSYLPYNLCASVLNVDLTTTSLYAYLEHELGLLPFRGWRVIEAVGASEYDARLLEVEEGEPMISFGGVTYLPDGCPIEWYHSVNRGDRCKFEVQLVRGL